MQHQRADASMTATTLAYVITVAAVAAPAANAKISCRLVVRGFWTYSASCWHIAPFAARVIVHDQGQVGATCSVVFILGSLVIIMYALGIALMQTSQAMKAAPAGRQKAVTSKSS